MKIMFVDDEKLMLEWLASCPVWKKQGIRIIGAYLDAKEAIFAAKASRPDVILCDIRMPGMDGFEFAERISGFLPLCKLVFISACNEKDHVMRALRLHIYDYLFKPITEDQLTHLIKKIVEESYGKNTANTETAGENSESTRIIETILRDVQTRYHQKISLETYAKQYGFSYNYMSTLFSRYTGKGFINYLTMVRMRKAKELLRGTSMNVREVSEAVGYVDYHYFSRLFKKHYGIPPSDVSVLNDADNQQERAF